MDGGLLSFWKNEEFWIMNYLKNKQETTIIHINS